jgi:hypothetical protein
MNRINIYTLTHENKEQELKTIQYKKNCYKQQRTHLKQKHKLSTNNPQETQKPKWATFTY